MSACGHKKGPTESTRYLNEPLSTGPRLELAYAARIQQCTGLAVSTSPGTSLLSPDLQHVRSARESSCLLTAVGLAS